MAGTHQPCIKRMDVLKDVERICSGWWFLWNFYGISMVISLVIFMEYLWYNDLVGGWLSTPLKRIRVRQLGWWFPIYGKIESKCSSHHHTLIFIFIFTSYSPYSHIHLMTGFSKHDGKNPVAILCSSHHVLQTWCNKIWGSIRHPYHIVTSRPQVFAADFGDQPSENPGGDGLKFLICFSLPELLKKSWSTWLAQQNCHKEIRSTHNTTIYHYATTWVWWRSSAILLWPWSTSVSCRS